VDDLAHDGLGVVFISSELEEVVEGSDRAVALKDGAIVGMLSGDEVNENRLMALLAEGGATDEGAGDADER